MAVPAPPHPNDGHLLLGDVDVLLPQGAHEARAVGDRARQDAVIIDHGVARTGELDGRREPVQEPQNRDLVWHRDGVQHAVALHLRDDVVG
jgi:hypothetical protein